MGNYAAPADVAALFRDIEFDTDTAVTETEINDIIDEVEAEINAKMTRHYVVPVTGVESLKIMKKITRLKSAHMVKTILEAREELSDKVMEVQTNLEKKADAMLDDIIPTWDEKCCEWVDPRYELIDAERKQTSPVSGNLFSSNTGTSVIKKGGNNW